MNPDIAAARFERYRQPAALRERWLREGLVTDALVGPTLYSRLRQFPGNPAVVDGEQRLSNGELAARSERLAGALLAAGVEQGDVVSWQVPNWWEALAIALAVWRIGAVNNPVLMIYREHELRQIFADLSPEVVIAPASFRGFRHQEMLDSVLEEIGHEPALRVGVRGGEGRWADLEQLVEGAEPAPLATAAGPGDPCVVAYTSGTTAGAKGVVIDHAALLAETRQMRETWGMSWDDVSFMPAPLAHLTGVTVGLTVPFTAGGSVVLMDKWDGERAVAAMERERCGISSGTPIFLEEIVRGYEELGTERASLRQYSVGGQAVVPTLIERAEAVGIGAFRCYGMTEHLSTTIANRSLPLETRRDTDGPVGPGSEISCVDEEGRVLAPGQQGEIRVRGPERMMGYVNPAHNEGVLDPEEGWFSTGDVGYVDADGNVHISGRIKDIINRGGEKFSAREMEDMICRHPDVRQAAVVPAPDARFGEVPAAFLVLTPGSARPEAEEMARFVQGQGLAKQKTPVSWQVVEALPATPFGKVRKQELVEFLEPQSDQARMI
jgi:acyl-coenzyme A synthetase/AMP-(fatty) acid ligase